MATVNEEFFDALVRHQIFLLRVGSGLRKKIDALLDATEADMVEEIKRRLARSGDGLTPANLRRLQLLERSIKATRARAWSEINDLWITELVALAKSEPETVAGMFQTVAPVQLDFLMPAASQLRALVTTMPFEGKTMKQWADGIRQADLDRIMSQIRIGLVSGEPTPQIARRIVGSARQRGTNGVTEITRRNANAITRTAINAFANAARSEFFKANSALFTEEVYTATLDSRTTAVCKANDGKRFPVGEGPMPPLHFNCRSLRVAVINGEVLGDRPMKPVTEQMLLRRYAARAGIRAPGKRGGLPHGHKGAFDQFARGEIRRMTGQVPAATNYQQWLTRQSKEFTDDVLGVTRSKLFRQGGLTLDKFVNRAGDELNLSQLARQHASAFRAAGLNPEDFL